MAPYEQAISISPNNARVRYNLGWIYNDQSRYGDAVTQLGEATRLKPEYVEAHRSEEHTSELQSRSDLVCRLLLEKKKNKNTKAVRYPSPILDTTARSTINEPHPSQPQVANA